MDWEDTRINGHLYRVEDLGKFGHQSDDDFFSDNIVQPQKRVMVFETDTLTCAQQLLQKKYKPLVVTSLIMDNYNDAMAAIKTTKNLPQTMSTLLRSNLFLIEFGDKLCTTTVFKDKKYEKINPTEIDTILVRPNKFPKLIGVGKHMEYENNSNSLLGLISEIFKTAYNRGYNCILFPDLGCDVGHPIELVVKYFNMCIQKYPIKTIIFTPGPNFTYFNKNIYRGAPRPKGF